MIPAGIEGRGLAAEGRRSCGSCFLLASLEGSVERISALIEATGWGS